MPTTMLHAKNFAVRINSYSQFHSFAKIVRLNQISNKKPEKEVKICMIPTNPFYQQIRISVMPLCCCFKFPSLELRLLRSGSMCNNLQVNIIYNIYRPNLHSVRIFQKFFKNYRSFSFLFWQSGPYRKKRCAPNISSAQRSYLVHTSL